MQIVFLAGRRGAGKSTVARALVRAGWTAVHTASVAARAGCEKNESGVLQGVAAPLLAAISAAGAKVVVDGSPRSTEQVRLVASLAENHNVHIVVLDVSAQVSSERMRRRGDSELAIARSLRRWDATERRALEQVPQTLVSVVDSDRAEELLSAEVLTKVARWEDRLRTV